MSDTSNTAWHPSSAWAGTALAARRSSAGGGTPVLLTPYPHIDMAALLVCEGARDAFAAVVRDLWALEVPAPGRAAIGDQQTLLYVAPDQYLLIAPGGIAEDALARRFAGTAALSLQGDGRAVVGLAGASSRRLLNKGISIDLHPTVFHSGCCAGTALAHGAVQLVQTDDLPTYLLIAPRTVAGSIADWILESAAEFGYEIRTEHLADPSARAA